MLALLAAGAACGGRTAPSEDVVVLTRLEPGIRGAATLRLAGAQRFAFVSADSAAEVRWVVDRQVRPHTGAVVSDTAVLRATGHEVTLDLPAAPGEETVYRLRASDGRTTDTAVVRVVPAGARAIVTLQRPGLPELRTHVIAPPTLGPRTRPLVVLHDADRDAVRAAEAWLAWAPAHDVLVVAPEFDQATWPGARAYELGNVFDGDDVRGTANPEEEWSFTLLETLARQLRRELDLDDDRVDLFGHAAGAEVAHRLTLFRPDLRVRRAFVAAAGWYTLPDTAQSLPYGVRSTTWPFAPSDVRRWTRSPLVLLRGTADTLRDATLRTTPEAERQGPTRFARAATMLDAARRFDSLATWRLVDVPDAEGGLEEMVRAAQGEMER